MSFVSLIVDDIDQSTKWYTETLKLNIINQQDLSDRGIKMANLANDRYSIELIEMENAISIQELTATMEGKIRVEGIFKFGFKVDDFDLWMKHLTDQDVSFIGDVVIDPVSDQRMILVSDPDGNRVQFFESK